MLVLMLKQDQTVTIQTPAGEIVVKVTDIRPDKVKIGFEAPRAIAILRENAVWRQPKEARKLMTEQELYDVLWAAKLNGVFPVKGFAVLAKDMTFHDFNGQRTTFRQVPAGTKVRVVMVSRMGDVGITDDLQAQTGYKARCTPGDGYLIDCEPCI